MVGLVIITPAAGFVTPMGAVIMAALGCVLVYPVFQLNKTLVDDTLDAFPCHGASGFVGTVLTGLFAQDGGLFYGGGWRLLGVQLAAALATFAYAAGVTAVLYGVMSRFMRMRVSASQELVGLDLGPWGSGAGGGVRTQSMRAGTATFRLGGTPDLGRIGAHSSEFVWCLRLASASFGWFRPDSGWLRPDLKPRPELRWVRAMLGRSRPHGVRQPFW